MQRMAYILSFLLFLYGNLFAADQSSNELNRPKIGLALSGGGARGIAHIGVLEWFEKHHIPIDYIAGTSMGGLVGGIYSTGRTASEIRGIFYDIDWDEVLSGSPAYNELSFRRKQDQKVLQNKIELGFKNGIKAPLGLNTGHNIELIFDRLTLPYSTIKNFDELPIKFRCIATDMVEGKPVILKDGKLSTAMRATMAIPGVFTPVERNGKILADGGLVNNIPTNIVKQMGADIVIAIDIGTPLGNYDSLNSLFGVLQQASRIALIDNDRRSLRLADIIIAPDLEKFTLLDFREVKQIADLGYKATEEKLSILKNFALGEVEWEAYLENKQTLIKTNIPIPNSLEIIGTQKNISNEIKNKLDKHVNKPINTQNLERDLTQIRGGGRFESLGYTLESRDNQDNLLIRTKEKNYGPPFFTPFIRIEATGSDSIQAAIGGRFTLFDVGGYRSELRMDARIGSQILLSTEYYKPMGQSGFFVAPNVFYDDQTYNLLPNEMKKAGYQIRKTGIGLDTGYTFRQSEIRIGYGFNNIKGRINTPDTLTLEGKESRVFMRYEFDNTNDAVIPSQGIRFLGEGRYFLKTPGEGKNIPQAEVNLSIFNKIGQKGILSLNTAVGTTFTQNISTLEQFALGGPLRLSAYGRDEFHGNHYIFTNIGYLHEIYSLPSIIGGKVYASGAIESGGAFNSFKAADYYMDLTGNLVVVTAFGPISIGASLGEGGHSRLYFSIGKIF